MCVCSDRSRLYAVYFSSAGRCYILSAPTGAVNTDLIAISDRAEYGWYYALDDYQAVFDCVCKSEELPGISLNSCLDWDEGRITSDPVIPGLVVISRFEADRAVIHKWPQHHQSSLEKICATPTRIIANHDTLGSSNAIPYIYERFPIWIPDSKYHKFRLYY